MGTHKAVCFYYVELSIKGKKQTATAPVVLYKIIKMLQLSGLSRVSLVIYNTVNTCLITVFMCKGR